MADTLLTDEQIDAIWAKETLDITVHRRFARAVLAAAVPPGHKVVPLGPTKDMNSRGAMALYDVSGKGFDATGNEIAAVYRAMIQAATERTP